ncbi:unnamed protein product [Owenia fusiformis]|uniref:Phosphatidylinositol-3-phosphatase SAC1 n=1 Tax=Owenia fusiformis TaxID=6347 RepID=A0A8S4NIY3_OWEFU|nr:unnamed protein product [Owenia fusiformis]
MTQPVHETLRLYTTPEKYFIEPLDSGSNELLIIDRVSFEISLVDGLSQIPDNTASKLIYGLWGIIRLVAGPYLVVITKKTKAGEIDGQTIWRVASSEVLPFQRTMLHLSEAQIADNKAYLTMVEYMLKQESYYFSSTYDLTHSLQRLYHTSPDFVQMPLHERADPRFMWNGHMLRELSQQHELSRFCVPILHGYISINNCTIKGHSFEYILISRRCCYRAGTRYYMRGLDQEGHAANFVETEQIVQYDGYRGSFVQTRGSIPLYWHQRPNLQYKPDPQLYSSSNHMDGFSRHFDSQVVNYGKQVLINLIDHKGPEDLLEKAFAQQVTNSQNALIRYESFDFHHECRKMRWDRLSILMDRLAEEQEKFSFFMIKKDGTLLRQQEGVFRTNCIDCLDRTNVVQSLLARRSLLEQFQQLGMLSPGERVEDQVSFEKMFKNVWADNADACAKQYAGTGALKTDFTRTGKRTKYGLLQDGVNAVVRYFKNNFSDGFKQDAIDLMLGNYIVDESEGIAKPSPMRQEKDWKFYAFPVIFLIAFSMCVISILIPDEHPSEQIMYVLFWSTASIVSLGAMYLFGNEFVDRPRLAQAKPKVD